MRDQHVDGRGRGDAVARLQVHGRLRQPLEGDQFAPSIGLGEAAAHYKIPRGGAEIIVLSENSIRPELA